MIPVAADRFRPRTERSRRHRIVDYLVKNYSGHPVLPQLARDVNDLLEAGEDVTTEVVDSIYAKRQAEWLKVRKETQAQSRPKGKARGSLGYTYFLGHGGNVKIGYSRNPRERALGLCLRESDILGVIESQATFERACHKKWDHLRIGDTEWFTGTDELLAWIRTMAQPWHYRHHSRTETIDIEQNYRRLLYAMTRAI